MRLMMPSTSTSGPPLHSDLVRKLEQFVEVLVRQLQHLQRLVLVEAFAALQYLVACLRQNVAHLLPPVT